MCPLKVIYEVTVVTGDVQNAGTDTVIYMSVFGANGGTEEMLLKKNEDRWNVHNSRAGNQLFSCTFETCFFFFFLPTGLSEARRTPSTWRLMTSPL